MKHREQRLSITELFDLLHLQKVRLVLAMEIEPVDDEELLELGRQIRDTREEIARRLAVPEMRL
jgi:hypothetical protein